MRIFGGMVVGECGRKGAGRMVHSANWYQLMVFVLGTWLKGCSRSNTCGLSTPSLYTVRKII